MDEVSDSLAVQNEFVVSLIDPIVRRVLAAEGPHDAYWAATDIPNALQGDTELPSWGAMYVAWSELADVFETGRTPADDAYAALRRAATDWLERPDEAGPTFFGAWSERATQSVGALYARDGNFWTVGHVAGRPYWLSVDGARRVDVQIGDGLPILQDALRDSLGTRPEAGQVEAVWKRVERAISQLEENARDGRETPFASGSMTLLRVARGRVEARYLRDSEDSDRVDTAPVDDVMALLVAWRRRMFGLLAEKATEPGLPGPPPAAGSPPQRVSTAKRLIAWLVGH